MKTFLSRLFVAVFALSFVLIPLSVNAQEEQEQHESAPAEEPSRVDDETLRQFEAKSLSELEGITVDEALEAIKRQPRVGELQAALDERGPAEFGGLYIQYQPSYALNLLAEPKGESSVREAISTLGFDDLKQFVSVRETVFTENALHVAQAALGRIRNVRFTWNDIDIKTGRVLAAVEGSSDVEGAREAIKRADLGRVPPERVDVLVSGTQQQHSYGGLSLNPTDGTLGCTSGFTVLHTPTGDEGIVDAGHCPGNERLGHHDTVGLTFIAQKNQDSADAQWYKTPGLDDVKQFRVNDSGDTRWVYNRVNRTAMSIGDWVCKYGKTTGYGCSSIASKSFDPDTLTGTTKYNATWIRMNDDITKQGDSGAPWFLVNDAYGIHTGSTTCGAQSENIYCYSYFMAQDYLPSALDVQVRIVGG